MNIQRVLFRVSASSALLIVSTFVSANPGFGEWGNSGAVPGVAGGCPIESRSGNQLFTAGGFDGTLDIWVYSRTGRVNDFGPRVKVGPPASLENANDFCPTPLPGGWLLFVSNRPGGCGTGDADLYLTRYSLDDSVPTPEQATNLGCFPDGPNTSATELSPSLVVTPEGTYLYYSSNAAGTQDIYRSRMAMDGSFGPGELVDGVNTAFHDQQPNVSSDGLEMVFSSNRDGTQDVFSASRDSLDEPWTNVRNLTVELGLPTVDGNETRASMSWDRKRLYYGSAGTIFVSSRQPGAGSP